MKVTRFFSVFLLLFVGIGALYGGWALMADPTGGKIQLPFHWIQNSFFKDYFWPGLILFVMNGICSLIAVLAILMKWKNYHLLIIAQGFVIIIWIITQILLLHLLFWLQGVIGACGVAMLILGMWMSGRSKNMV